MTGHTPETRFRKSLRIGIETILFLAVLSMFPFTSDPAGDIKYLILSVGAFLLCAVWLYGSRRAETPFQRPWLFFEILAVWLLLSLVAGLASDFVQNSLAVFCKFGAFFLIYVIASQAYRSVAEIRRMMLVFCLAVALASLYALFVQRTGLDPFPWSDRTGDIYTDLPATFGNPNYAAHTLILAIILALYLATDRKMLWCAGLVALFVVHQLYTHQRGGLVALAAALVLVVSTKLASRRFRRPVWAAAVGLTVTGLLVLIGLATVMVINEARKGTPFPLGTSLRLRYNSYYGAVNMISEAPILGYGPGNYKIICPEFWTPFEQEWFATENKMNAHVHNDPLEAAVDAGFPAACLYLAFLLLGMIHGLCWAVSEQEPLRRRLGYAFAAFCCAFLVDGALGFNLHVPVPAMVLFAMAGAFEGLWSAHHSRPTTFPRWLRPFALRSAALLLGFFVFVSGSCTFAARVLFQRGTAVAYAGRDDMAETLWSWGERLAPWDWRFARRQGVAYARQGQWDDAVACLERSLTRNPNYIMTLTALAQAKWSQGMAQLSSPQTGGGERDTKAIQSAALTMFDDGTRHAQKILELCPMFAEAEDLLGRLAAGRSVALSKWGVTNETVETVRETWREAENHFLRAIDLGIENKAGAYRQLAQTRVALGDTRGAEEAIVFATQADPADDTIWPLFYGFARDTGRYDQFRTALMWRIERLNEQSPPNKDTLALAYTWLGNILHDGYRELEEAETAYRNAVRTAPMRPEVWSAYASFAGSAARVDSFKAFLIETNSRILREGKQPLPHVSAVASVWNRGPEALLEASTMLVAVVQGRVPIPVKQPVELEMGWAVAYLLAELRNARLDPADSGPVLLHMAMVMSAIQDLEGADRLFPAAMPNLPPDLQGVCAQYWADVMVRLQRPHEAVNLLRDTKSRMPENIDVRHALARSLIKCGKPEDAKAEYEALLQLPALKDEDRKRIQAEMQEVFAHPSNASPQPMPPVNERS